MTACGRRTLSTFTHCVPSERPDTLCACDESESKMFRKQVLDARSQKVPLDPAEAER